jgi:hypothetical protein
MDFRFRRFSYDVEGPTDSTAIPARHSQRHSKAQDFCPRPQKLLAKTWHDTILIVEAKVFQAPVEERNERSRHFAFCLLREPPSVLSLPGREMSGKENGCETVDFSMNPKNQGGKEL